MNHEHSEQIFDSLLEEMLTEQHPPDLTSRIVTAWKMEISAPPQAVAKDAAAASFSAALPIQVSSAEGASEFSHAQPPVAKTSVAPAAKQLDSGGYSRTRVAWVLATLAATLLIFLGWKASQVRGPDPVFAQAPLQVPELPNVPPPAQAASNRETPKVRETLPLDDLPFSNSESIVALTPPSARPLASTSEKLDSREVVAELDRRLRGMWSNLGVTPSPTYETAALAQQIAATLTGQELPVAPSGEFDRTAMTSDALDSRAFSLRWAEKFMADWLGEGVRRQGLDTEALTQLKQTVAARIENGGKWNEVVVDLLGGSLEDPDSSSAYFVAALAGGENHHLIEQLGTSFLDANLACIRCHDTAARPQLDTEKQQTYWALVAMLKGLDSQMSETGVRRAVDQQAELFAARNDSKVFFDLPNGALKSAEARLPDGSNWLDRGASPRQALATWISQSPGTDRATVNLVWKQIFGRPLVPYVAQTDSVAVANRTELLDFLAGQFRAHDHDLKNLVAWVVNSEAFNRQPLNLDKSQWLETSDVELQNYQLQELVFAAGPSLGRTEESKSLESSLLAVVQWEDRNDSNATLAQPSTDEGNRKPRLPSSVTMPSMSFVLHGQQPTISQQNFVKSLLRAERLSWEQRVDHVAGLSGRYSANGRVQQLARQLLEENSGDTSSALLQLLWAVQNSDAG